jgi:uncharacterized membrane protein
MAEIQSSGGGVKKGTGLASNIASLLCYVLCPPFGSIAIVLLEEKSNGDVQFHGWQGMILGFALWCGLVFIKIFTLIAGDIIGGIIWWLFVLGTMTLFIVGAIKAYQGERWKIPLIGDFAAKKAGV